ncbi:hypothetical protein [Elizabethkingia anophelis]|uniref:hypothetical protein n=1 Tax=Elizabethkingia anophelis TaxID=1117645 RepID=UPI001626B106|nr:hypothetical protein [Elizabethkingia anophelis]MCT4321829.1 hypothetical protein [Elizabethkingia anophelis]
MEPKCPKCNSKNVFLKEIWKNHAIEFELENGKWIGKSMEPGYPYKVEGHCKDCSTNWTLRKLNQIIDLDNGK